MTMNVMRRLLCMQSRPGDLGSPSRRYLLYQLSYKHHHPSRISPHLRYFSSQHSCRAISQPRITYQGRPDPSQWKQREDSPDALGPVTVREIMARGKLFDPESGRLLVQARQLRNACKCELCVNPSDRQRNYHWAEIPVDIEVQSHEVDANGTYSIRWKNDVPGFDDHVSKYTKQEVLEAAFFLRRHGQTVFRRPIHLWKSSTYNYRASKIIYDDFMNTPGALGAALNCLYGYGLAFITEVPKDEMSVGRIAERIGPLRNTFYGLMWDVRSVPNAKNVAYTSRNLGLHMDLLYMQEPPGLQLLHCMENTCEGGLSQFVDTYKALDDLITQQGNCVLRDLAGLNVPYEYNNDGAYYYDRKPVVSFDAYPRLPRYIPDAKNAFVMSKVQRVYWSPPFAAPHMNATRRTSAEHVRSAKAFADILEAPGMAFTTKLSPGTCAIFDNLRVCHARTAFDTTEGHRWLRGAYIDHQDFYSKAVALEGHMPEFAGKLSLDADGSWQGLERAGSDEVQ